MSDKDQPAFDIILNGGIVQAVAFNDPALQGQTYRVIDLDTDGADDDELTPIKRPDGTEIQASCTEDEIIKPEYKFG
ncbi:MAG: hypothetical protein ACFHHU_00680 [Porticoccaceae bacterium]